MPKEKSPAGPGTLKTDLKALKDIVDWFDSQDEVDVELGLEKVRQGAALVKATKMRLAEIENEFEEIQREMETDPGAKAAGKQTKKAVRGFGDDEETSASQIPF